MHTSKKKTRTLSSLKAEAWRCFSRYIRLRDCVRTTGEIDAGICITCGKRIPFNGSQAGHFLAGRTNAILFDEDIVHLQCLTEDSLILMNDLFEKSIKDVKVGDKIKAFNEQTFRIEDAVILNTDNYIPRKLYKVELEDGKTFYATGDHMVVANGEWKRIDEILHSFSEYDILEIWKI